MFADYLHINVCSDIKMNTFAFTVILRLHQKSSSSVSTLLLSKSWGRSATTRSLFISMHGTLTQIIITLEVNPPGAAICIIKCQVSSFPTITAHTTLVYDLDSDRMWPQKCSVSRPGTST